MSDNGKEAESELTLYDFLECGNSNFGRFRVHGNVQNPEEFKRRIKVMEELRAEAQQSILGKPYLGLNAKTIEAPEASMPKLDGKKKARK